MVKLLIIFQAGEIGNSIIHRYKSYDEIRCSEIRFAFADKDSTNKFWKKLYPEDTLEIRTGMFILDSIKNICRKYFNTSINFKDWITVNIDEIDIKDAHNIIRNGGIN